MRVDYIIVGIGLAGISFCEQLKSNNKTFVVFDNGSQQSSIVASGLYNPVVLKRFTSVWKNKEQLKIALPLYEGIEKKLNIKLDYKISIYRKFASLEEQNDWFLASDKLKLSEYISAKIIKNNNPFINAPFGFGEVLQAGRIDVKTLVEAYKSYLINNNLLIEDTFGYNDLKDEIDFIQYKNIRAKHIVFTEGFGMDKNPFFKHLPLVATKGESLIIRATDLKIDYVLKSGVFIIPLENDLYIVGATYDREDKTNVTTKKAKDELLTKLNKLISCKYEIVYQVAGIRPTVKDRRPLVGQHKIFKNMYILNGLGTRGVLIGPYVAKQLYNFVENKIPLEEEVDINRFG